MESGAEGTRLHPLQGEGDRRAVEGFWLREWRAEFGKLRAEFGEWRVELKALVCLPCKGRGTAERWRGFD